RVELIKGPATFLNGVAPGGSIVGAINVVPKFATDNPILWVQGSYQSNANFGLSTDVGQRYGEHKEWGVRVAATGRDGDTNIRNNSTELGAVEGTIDYRGERFRAFVDFGYKHLDVGGYSLLLFPSAALPFIPAAPNGANSFANRWQTGKTEHVHALTKFEY